MCVVVTDKDAVTICPVAGLVTVDGVTAEERGVEVDSSMFDIAEASSFSFSSDSWERIDFIPLGGCLVTVTVLVVDDLEVFTESCESETE